MLRIGIRKQRVHENGVFKVARLTPALLVAD
jgi:hypothetical protein